MSSSFKIFKNLAYRVQLTFLIFLLFVSVAFADYYDQRPDILKVSPKPIAQTDPWSKSRDGHFVLLAQLLTFFPDADFYFLARDIEYLYDISRVLFKNNPAMLERLKIVPVSTSLSYNLPETRAYLEQEGVTKSKLGKRTALFVDSCCAGSVPDRIKTAFSNSGLDIKGFLIQAAGYPSSSLAAALGTSGIGIEGLPHHTQSASAYEKKKGVIRVTAAPAYTNMKAKSKQIMQDIRYHYDNAAARERLRDMTAQMRIVFSRISNDSIYKPVTQEEAMLALKRLVDHHGLPLDPLLNDMGATARKQYRKIDAAKMSALKTAYVASVGTDTKFFISKVAKGEHTIASISQMLSADQATLKQVLMAVTEALLDEKLKVEGVSKAVLQKNRDAWAGQMHVGIAAQHFNDAEGMRLLGDFLIKVKKIDMLKAIAEHLIPHAKTPQATEELRQILIKTLNAERLHFTANNSFIGKIIRTPAFNQNHVLTEGIIRHYLLSAPKAEVQSVLSYFNSNFGHAIGWGNSHSKKHFEQMERFMGELFQVRPEFAKDVVESVLKIHFFHGETANSESARRFVRFVLSQPVTLTDAQKSAAVSTAFVSWLLKDKTIYAQNKQVNVMQLMQKLSISRGVPSCKNVYL